MLMDVFANNGNKDSQCHPEAGEAVGAAVVDAGNGITKSERAWTFLHGHRGPYPMAQKLRQQTFTQEDQKPRSKTQPVCKHSKHSRSASPCKRSCDHRWAIDEPTLVMENY